VLAAASEEHLRTIAGVLDAAGVAYAAIVESDPPYTGSLMAIGVVPASDGRVRRLLSSLPLAK